MKMDDMVIVSVDDHISEPPDLFNQLSGEALATAPKFLVAPNGTNYWEYQGHKVMSVASNAVVGRPLDEYGVEPTSLDQLRKGCYDVHARIGDMNVNGIAGSLNFGSAIHFDGGLFYLVPDRKLSITHLRAYNDWQVDEWCGAYPGRFIPNAVLPLWDMDASVKEIHRLVAKGCYAFSMSENPTVRKLPSIHNEYWEPLWKAINDTQSVLCLHIGVGNPSPHASMETPIEAWITTMPMSISTGAADWLNLEALGRYPDLKIALSEGGIGWIPYFVERADFSNSRHKAWTHSGFKDKKPSQVFREHFLTCFVDDIFGLKYLDEIGEDIVAYECDYPHSDCLWPEVPEFLWKSVKHLSDERIDKVTHKNAMRFFHYDPIAIHGREALTVGALREQARKDGVDTTVVSSGGAKPIEEGDMRRPVTSGDVIRMFMEHANGDGPVKGFETSSGDSAQLADVGAAE